ncbi:hypothetical protein U0070_005389, partial [Myodes glareolus]
KGIPGRLELETSQLRASSSEREADPDVLQRALRLRTQALMIAATTAPQQPCHSLTSVSCCGQTEKAAARCWGAMAPDGLVKPSERPILPDLHRSLCRGNMEQDEAEIHWAARHPADL